MKNRIKKYSYNLYTNFWYVINEDYIKIIYTSVLVNEYNDLYREYKIYLINKYDE